MVENSRKGGRDGTLTLQEPRDLHYRGCGKQALGSPRRAHLCCIAPKNGPALLTMTSRSFTNLTSFLVLSAGLGALLVLPATGCGDSEAPPRAPVSVRVTEFIDQSDLQRPMPGAEVCEIDTTNCTMTDEDGMATIDLLADAEVSYTITKEGFASYLWSDVNNGQLEHWTWMFPEEEVTRLAGLIGTTFPGTGDGLIIIRAFTDPGVMFDLVGESNEPFYFLDGGTPSRDIDATTEDRRGGFTDVAPGEYQIDVIGAPGPCQPFVVWPGDQADRFKLLVRAGFISWVSVTCQESGSGAN